ncbi:MAG TPA: phosphatidylserine/phosphatidylglycerophosphate/cardiolipin synthase family protein [Candidatus Dormibacteraeota bacterium]|nr:phosphatidylserine/phosphatidylglycerophosphate/cardiolipin synthase family protein [Candidatus Dormibacteraeota bacterium]
MARDLAALTVWRAVVRVVCLLSLFLLSLAGCSNPAAASGATALVAAGSSAGHDVRLWQDAHIFQLVGSLIGSASHRVLVEMYELGRSDIVSVLGAARERGVDVRVITDPTVKQSRKSAVQLDRLHVPERVYPVDDARHQIDHVKLLIADGEAAVGGMNWGKASDRNHDYVLETRITIEVNRLAGIFDQDWALAGGRPSPLAMAAGEIAQTAPGVEIRAMLEGALRRVTRQVLAEVFTLTDPTVVADLVIAEHRGVAVRVLLDPNQSYNLHAFALLHAGGVGVRWYPVPKGALLHAKIGLFDAELILGSANWTVSGLDVNHELDIETKDSVAVEAYVSRFEADWIRSSG